MRIVLAYSGSVEGSAAIQWLRERHTAEVVTVTLDLGQGRELEAIRDRALRLGAQRAHVLDARDEFADEYVVPALKADATHTGQVPMARALSRPLIAKKLIEIAGIEHSDAVAHTGHASGGSSQLDRLLVTLARAMPILTPTRDWALSAVDLEAFARANGFGSLGDDASHLESNFWGRSLRYSAAVPAPTPLAPRAPEACPSEPAFVDIAFVHGVPSALNRVTLPLAELVASLGTLAATHGLGHARTTGLLCDAPAAVLLHAAHRELTRVASRDEVEQFSAGATLAYVDLVENSRWFSPLREALDAYFSATQAHISGHVRLRLLKGEYATITTGLVQPPSGATLPVVPSPAQH